jgi:heme A synthase
VTVKLDLHPLIVVTHLTIAIALLATIVVALVRAGGLGAARLAVDVTPRTMRAAKIAVALTLATLVLGALTANVPGAPIACRGFPWCRTIEGGATPIAIQITHRVLAFLVFGHLIGMFLGSRRRNEDPTVRLAIASALGLVVLQVIVAAGMVEMNLPPVMRSLHQAVGTATWIAVVAVAALAANPQRVDPPPEVVRDSPSRGTFATPEGVST